MAPISDEVNPNSWNFWAGKISSQVDELEQKVDRQAETTEELKEEVEKFRREFIDFRREMKVKSGLIGGIAAAVVTIAAYLAKFIK